MSTLQDTLKKIKLKKIMKNQTFKLPGVCIVTSFNVDKMFLWSAVRPGGTIK